jgi:hypothetical protein
MVTAALAASAMHELDQRRHSPDATSEDLQSARDRAQQLLLATDLLGGAALSCGGLSLYMTLRFKPRRGLAQAPVGFLLAPDHVGVRGRF